MYVRAVVCTGSDTRLSACFIDCPFSVLFMFFFFLIIELPRCRSEGDIVSKHGTGKSALHPAQVTNS